MKSAIVLLLLLCSTGYAQQRDTINRPSWSALRIAKWSTLTASTAGVIYGFTQNRGADRDYEEIERLCQDSPVSCARKTDSDEYADAALEARYQNIVHRDDRARVALLAGQFGIAASVVLFILDLSSRSEPEDIPYNPRPLRIGIDGDQLRFLLSFRTR